MRCLVNPAHLSDGSVLFGTGTMVVLPLLIGVEAAAGQIKLATEPGNRKAITECAYPAKPFGSSCSLAKCAAASSKNPFSLLSPRFSLRSRLSSALVACQLALIGGSDVAATDAILADPLGQDAVGHAQWLGTSPAGEALNYAELNSLLLLQRRELAPGLGWIRHR